jgi:hypothetical protein
VLGVISRGEQGGTRLLVVSAESGVKEIEAVWLGPITPPGPEVAGPHPGSAEAPGDAPLVLAREGPAG